MESLLAKLEIERNAHAEACARRDNVAERYAAACLALDTATQGRMALVSNAADGQEVDQKALARANASIAAALADKQLWSDASAKVAAGVDKAQMVVQETLKMVAEIRFAIACRNRILASEALQNAANVFNQAFLALRETEHDMGSAYNATNQAFAPSELEALRNWRDAAATLSPIIQEIIIQRRNTALINFADRERRTWQAWAAKADAA